jgi:hypothetical protein
MVCPDNFMQGSTVYFSPSYSDKSPSSNAPTTGVHGEGDFNLSEYKKLHEANIQKFRSRQEEIRLAGVSGKSSLSSQQISSSKQQHSGMVSWGLFPDIENEEQEGLSTNTFHNTGSTSSSSNPSASDAALQSLKKPFLRSSERMSISDIKVYILDKLSRYGYDEEFLGNINVDVCISKGGKVRVMPG